MTPSMFPPLAPLWSGLYPRARPANCHGPEPSPSAPLWTRLGCVHADKERLMTNRNDFTEDEWAQLLRAPMIAGFAISLADPGGPIELTKETLASLRAASSPPSNE